MPGITLNDVCLASMSAVALATGMLRAGEASVVLVGGFDSMTRAPHALRTRPPVRMGDQPMIDVMVHDGLYCSIADDGHGRDVGRRERAAARQPRGAGPLLGPRRTRGPRRERRAWPRRSSPVGAFETTRACGETSYDALAALSPAFTRRRHDHRGQRQSQVSDGAVAGAGDDGGAAARAGVTPLAEIVGRCVIAGPDSTLHLRPAEAARQAARAARADAGRRRPVGDQRGVRGRRAGLRRVARDRPRAVNVNGGAVALGHPLAASGLRLVLTLAYELRRRGGGLGVAAICGGGGQGEALLLRVPAAG